MTAPLPVSPPCPSSDSNAQGGTDRSSGVGSDGLEITTQESEPNVGGHREILSNVQVLPIDTDQQTRAMLDLLPVGRSFDAETTTAWLKTVEVSQEAQERYVYMSPMGADGSELGRGSTGRVLRVMDKHIGRDVALKELLPELVDSAGRRSAELRFVREARISGQLEHPNIITVYDMGRRPDGQLYYTMKLVRGRTLQTALRDARDREERLALLGHVTGLCQAIAYAHSEGVIHRDIKPENVMIGEFGETVVLDWGGARVTASSRNSALLTSIPPQSERRRWIGTPLYMSPEQAAGREANIDERSDVWALGVVLYQVLAGTLPFDGATFSELSKKIRNADFPPIHSVEPNIDVALTAIASRALASAPEDRYSSAREMARDLEAFRAGGLGGSHSSTLLDRLRRYVHR
jgi:serine/threonine protein kinase